MTVKFLVVVTAASCSVPVETATIPPDELTELPVPSANPSPGPEAPRVDPCADLERHGIRIPVECKQGLPHPSDGVTINDSLEHN